MRQGRGRVRVGLAVVLGAGVVGWAGGAGAQTADDHAAATALVGQLEHDTTHATVTASAVQSAKAALERATRLRAAGDEPHARAADGLAIEWAQTARDLAKAADAETTAADLRHKAVDAQAQLERTKALVEEGITRVDAGLQAESSRRRRRRPDPDRIAIEAHEERSAGEEGGREEAPRRGRPEEAVEGGEVRREGRRRPGLAGPRSRLCLGLVGCGARQLRVAALDDRQRARRGTEATRERASRPRRMPGPRRSAHRPHAARRGGRRGGRAPRAAGPRGLRPRRRLRPPRPRDDGAGGCPEGPRGRERPGRDARGLARAPRRAGDELEERARVLKERLLPARSEAAPEREAARLVAAKALAFEARLLCDAGHLVAPDALGLDVADAELSCSTSDSPPAPTPPPSTTRPAPAPAASTSSPVHARLGPTTRARPTRCSPSSRPTAAGTRCATSAASS